MMVPDPAPHRRAVCILVATAAIAAAGARPAAARVAPLKPTHTVLRTRDLADQVVLKFQEGTHVRLRAGRLTGPGVDLRGVARIIAQNRIVVERLFDRPEGDLDAERVIAEMRSGRTLADLNLYYRLRLPTDVDAVAICDALNASPLVEIAAPLPRPAPPSTDIPPTTPDLTDTQGHRASPPDGIGVADPDAFPGADGTGVQVVDVEYAWVLGHEDLGLTSAAIIDDATLVDPFPDDEGNHGTAVLGTIVGGDNDYGITGIAPGSTMLLAPANTAENGYDVGRAVSLATARLDAGDVILIEQQMCVCAFPCPAGTQDGFGPVEAFPPWYDAIATATAKGITVVEPAGNGDVDLDDPSCDGFFDRSIRDSGAIVVGAGTTSSHSRLGFSTFGSRVDVQGWGIGVTTTGYGDAFDPDPDDIRQRYTSEFSGTSAASAIVAGVAVSVQGVRRAAGGPPLSTDTLRQILVDTGTAQGTGASGHIGPLPDLPAALAATLAVPTTTTTFVTTTTTSTSTTTTTDTTPTPTTTSTTTTGGTTSTGGPGPTTTTAPPPGATTTTTFPTVVAECAAPGNCNDDEDCTVDDCEFGRCVFTPLVGAQWVDCQLGKLLAPNVCPDGIGGHLATVVQTKVARARAAVLTLPDATPPKAKRALRRRALKSLDALNHAIGRAARRGAITKACRDTLHGLVAERRSLVAGL